MAGSSEPLRIGLLVDTLQQPAWVRQIIADIQASEYARIVLVIKKDGPPKARASLARRIWRRRSRLAYLAYRWLDARAFRTSQDAFARQDTADLLAEAAVVHATVKETRFCDYVSDTALAQIRDAHPDVLLRFGFRILKGPILQAARYGVWSFHHGDNHVNRGGPAGFWEVMHEQPTTGSVLQILNEDLDNGRVICRSYAKTDRSSVWRNRNNYYWKSAAFVTRALRQLADCGPAALEGCSCGHGSRDVRFYSERLFRKPDNLETIALVGRYLTRRMSERVRRIREVDQWAIAFSLSKAAPSTTLYRFKEQWPPIGSSWADPFPVAAPDGYHIFLEVYDRATKRGHIGVSRLTREGVFDRPVTVLERPYHLSYPFVFRWRDTWFMMPETSNATRELKCSQLVSSLVNGRRKRCCSSPFTLLMRRSCRWKAGGGSSPMSRHIPRFATMTSSTRFTARLRLARGRRIAAIPSNRTPVQRVAPGGFSGKVRRCSDRPRIAAADTVPRSSSTASIG